MEVDYDEPRPEEASSAGSSSGGASSAGSYDSDSSDEDLRATTGYHARKRIRALISSQVLDRETKANKTMAGLLEQQRKITMRKRRNDTYAYAEKRMQEIALNNHEEGVVLEGAEKAREYREGDLVLRGSKTKNDPFVASHNAIYTETERWSESRSAWKSTYELQTAYSADEIAQINASEAEGKVALSAEISEYKKKHRFHSTIKWATEEYRRARNAAEEAAGEVLAQLEKLKRLGPGMSFEGRARAWRKLQDLKKMHAGLEESARFARVEADRMKRHVVNHGFKPATYVTSEEEEFWRGQDEELKDSTVEHTSEAAKPGDRYMFNATAPVVSNYGLGTKSDAWSTTVRKGLQYIKVDIMKKQEKARQQKHFAEKQKRDHAKEQEKLSASLRRIEKDQKQEKRNDDEWDIPVDYEMMALQGQNVAFQPKTAPIDANATTSVALSADQAPPLCRRWAMQGCPNTGIKCKHRHYFINNQEAEAWTSKRIAKNRDLERNVLNCITEREGLLAKVQEEGVAAQRVYNEHLSGYVKLEDVSTVLHLLAQLRVATVRTIEAIVVWRDDVERSYAVSKDTVAKGGDRSWVVKVATKGQRLYPGSTAYKSKIKRFCRDADIEGKRATVFELLGVYDNQIAALAAYDAAMSKMCTRLGTTQDKMPKPRCLVRSCGKHYAVESDVGFPETRCELCHVASFNGRAKWTPAYMWNGVNYLLKLIKDTEFLQKVECLSKFLGPSFPLKRNPLLLRRALGAAVIENEKAERKRGKKRKADEAETDSKVHPVALEFGNPSATVLKYDNACFEWFGHLSFGSTVQVGTSRAFRPKMCTDEAAVDGYVARNSGARVEIMDMLRVREAEKTILLEEDIAKYMHMSKLERKQRELKEKLASEKEARHLERERRREDGEIVDTSESEAEVEEEDSESSQSDSDIDNKTADDEGKMPENGTIGGTRMVTTYYRQGEDYLAVAQERAPLVGKVEGVWCNDKAGPWKSLYRKGRHLKHFNFEQELKRKGKILAKKRQKVIRRLDKAMKLGDFCDPDAIVELIEKARGLEGSLALAAAANAEKFLEQWEWRNKCATNIERIYRAKVCRRMFKLIKAKVARDAIAAFRSDRARARVARFKLSQWKAAAARNARRRLKEPLFKCTRTLDGESVILTIVSKERMKRARGIPHVVGTCLSCTGHTNRTRVSPSLTTLTVGGKMCSGSSKDTQRGIMRVQ